MKKRWVTVGSVILGAICIMLAFVYWTTPPTLLPSFLPGYEQGVAAIHVKHGIAAFVVGLAFFVLAWFSSGKKSDAEPPREDSQS